MTSWRSRPLKGGLSSTDPPDPPPPPLDLQKRVEEQEACIRQLQEEVGLLKTRLQTLEDLNQFTPCITSFYVAVFNELRFQTLRMHHGYCSWIYQNWIELFSAAQVEMRDFEEKKATSTPLNDMINKCMLRVGNITAQDWAHLQSLRKTR